jgi:hypothetical protein
MRLTAPETLCPGAREIERLVFAVRSQTNSAKEYRVDMEKRHGIGQCECKDAVCNKNPDCKHLTAVRKFITIKVAQAVIKSHETPKKPIRKVSQSQAARNRLYHALRKRYLMEHPFCMACRTVNEAAGYPLWYVRFSDDVHHRFGRLGELLFWEPGYMAVCNNCHRWIHDHPAKARELGLLAPVGQWNKTELAKS